MTSPAFVTGAQASATVFQTVASVSYADYKFQCNNTSRVFQCSINFVTRVQALNTKLHRTSTGSTTNFISAGLYSYCCLECVVFDVVNSLGESVYLGLCCGAGAGPIVRATVRHRYRIQVCES